MLVPTGDAHFSWKHFAAPSGTTMTATKLACQRRRQYLFFCCVPQDRVSPLGYVSEGRGGGGVLLQSKLPSYPN